MGVSDITKDVSLIVTVALILSLTMVFSGCTEQVEEPEMISLDDITNIEWQWTGLFETEPATQSVVTDPENYTIVLSSDMTYSIKADCNRGSGGYILDGKSLTLEPGPMTLAECGPESLFDEYVALLGNVTAAELDNGQLVFYVGDRGDKIFFVNAGTVE